MPSISSTGPGLLAKLKELVELMLDVRNNNSTSNLDVKIEELIEAVREITSR